MYSGYLMKISLSIFNSDYMRKIFSYIFIVIGIGIMVISTSNNITKDIIKKRATVKGPFGMRISSGGDLVKMAFLDKEEKFLAKHNYAFKKPADTANKNIDLYIFGDSYVMDVPDSAFAHVNKYYWGRRDYTDLNYKLDPRKRNILIIENGERFIRGYFKSPYIFDHLKKDTGGSSFLRLDHQTIQYAGFDFQVSDLFNPGAINQNLEYNLFNYNFLVWINQAKAKMNYRLFRRVSGDVVLSENGEHLFLRQTVAAHDILSCYEKVESKELLRIFSVIDGIYKHYRQEGFHEVYFSIIPNPATILQPQYYNGLIPAISKFADSAGIPIIDVYRRFSSHAEPATFFTTGDTHWNNNGLQEWIQAVNKALEDQSRTN